MKDRPRTDDAEVCPECDQRLLAEVRDGRPVDFPTDEQGRRVHFTCINRPFTWRWSPQKCVAWLEAYWAEKDAAARAELDRRNANTEVDQLDLLNPEET
ncbi:hypothetical protein [Saccharothrix hoggarensis]|uniref:Zinc finger protein n=1 Tax=Saccharothrix hoggarensis TaxID=913853 RepID=A0ABW3QLQ3_9PSEU